MPAQLAASVLLQLHRVPGGSAGKAGVTARFLAPADETAALASNGSSSRISSYTRSSRPRRVRFIKQGSGISSRNSDEIRNDLAGCRRSARASGSINSVRAATLPVMREALCSCWQPDATARRNNPTARCGIHLPPRSGCAAAGHSRAGATARRHHERNHGQTERGTMGKGEGRRCGHGLNNPHPTPPGGRGKRCTCSSCSFSLAGPALRCC